MNSYRQYLILLSLLTILSLLLCIITKVKLIDKYNYCNKSESELCNDPETIIIEDKQYLTCKNAKQLSINNNSGFIKYFIVPFISIIMVLSIILIINDINGINGIRNFTFNGNNIKKLLKHELIVPIFSIIFLIILIILQIIFYFSYKKKCLDDTYQCKLVSNLTFNNNNKNLGFIVNKCKSITQKHTNRTHKIVKNFNNFLFAVLIFTIYMILYNIDIEFDLVGLTSGNKFSDNIKPLTYIICVIIIFFINIIFSNSNTSYILNSLFILIIIILLGYYEYYNINIFN